MDFTVYLTASNTTITGGQPVGGATTEAGTTVDASAAPQAAPAGGLNLWMWVIIYAVVIGGYFLFVSRGQKKKDKQVQEMRSSIKVGDSVCTTSGFYGKISDIGDDVFVIEFGTNKGVRVPVNKGDVMAVKEPSFSTAKNEN